uniref:Uncharacterized protein n=1 Tax=Pseudo-nitzschia australis TaxID=44445 RepID=A0A7S4AH76_9STRA
MSEVWTSFQEEGRYQVYNNRKNEDFFSKKLSPLVSHHTAQAEKMCAREKFEMNVDEREAINNEIHGVKNRSVKENPSMIAQALLSLRKEIDNHLDNDIGDVLDDVRDYDKNKQNHLLGLFTKNAYWRGLDLNSAYIQSADFRIRFLRKTLFDVKEAAVHYFRYLDLIHDFFGDAALLRPLYLTDLTKRELQYFKRGQQQLFPSRDRSGRRIYAYLGCNNTEFNLREKYRVQTYLYDVMSQDETSQKLGIIIIGVFLDYGKVDTGGDKNTQCFRRSAHACPVRISAFHICFPDKCTIAYHVTQLIVFLFLGKKMRSLLQYHRGSIIENCYHLCSYGIPSGDIPLTSGGKIKTKNVATFIHARAAIEDVQKHQIGEYHQLQHNQQRQQQHQLGRSRRLTIPLPTATTITITSQNNSHGNSITRLSFRIPVYSVVECPDINYVVFGDKRMFEQAGNIKFRSFLRDMEDQRMERIKNYDESINSLFNFVHDIIKEARSLKDQNFFFYSYQRDKSSLYREITDHDELHRRVHQVLRDLRKRSRWAENKNNSKIDNSITGSSGNCMILSSPNSAVGTTTTSAVSYRYTTSTVNNNLNNDNGETIASNLQQHERLTEQVLSRGLNRSSIWESNYNSYKRTKTSNEG